MKSVLLLFPLLIAAVRATGETPLRQAANGSRVRFLGLRTFDNPVVVGMEKNGKETTLRRKTAGMGFDGSQRLPGVNLNGQCHPVDRWCGRGIRELHLRLFRLTGMEIPGNDIY